MTFTSHYSPSSRTFFVTSRGQVRFFLSRWGTNTGRITTSVEVDMENSSSKNFRTSPSSTCPSLKLPRSRRRWRWRRRHLCRRCRPRRRCFNNNRHYFYNCDQSTLLPFRPPLLRLSSKSSSSSSFDGLVGCRRQFAFERPCFGRVYFCLFVCICVLLMVCFYTSLICMLNGVGTSPELDSIND